MPATRSEVLEDVLEEQHFVARRSQLIELGVSRSRIRWQVDRGGWRELGPTVLVLQTGPLAEEQRRWAAALLGGPGSGLSGLTALAAQGLRGWDDEDLHLLVPHGRRTPLVDGLPLRVHRTRRDIVAGLQPGRPLPLVRLERAVLDAVAWTSRPRTAVGLVAAVVQQRLTTAERLIPLTEADRCLPHRRIVLPALHDIGGGAQALSEIDFGVLCRRFGLPRPRRQVVRRDHQGRRRYVDAELVGPDGRVVLAEVDGALHLLAKQYWQDMERLNELTIAGERLLRFPTVVFRSDPAKCADQLARALGLGGISGRHGSR